MKRIIFLFAFIYGLNNNINAQIYNDTLDVVTWNLRLFGSDTTLVGQTTNVKNVMNGIGADIYACQEVVNVDSFKWLANNLNGNFGYYYSYYGSGAVDTNSINYKNSLKFGFLYRKSMVGTIMVRPLMQSSATVNTNTNGRFPFFVKCDVKCADNIWRPFKFVIIHTKSTGDSASCSMRTQFFAELKDTLDTYYPNDSLTILGDYNEDLDTTICASGGQSNAQPFLNDSTNYFPVTLEYSKLNIGSMIGNYNNMIDHIIVSNEMKPFYVNNSAKIIKNYTWAATSDHHPVKAQFIIPQNVTAITGTENLRINLYPNPTATKIYIEADFYMPIETKLHSIYGQLLLEKKLEKNENYIDIQNLSNGIYYLTLRQNNKIVTKKIMKR
ncbi:MAG: T9SS type A sorting domain-containing protein [Chitinophagaceae bacterium]